jgi:hypothetical protein
MTLTQENDGLLTNREKHSCLPLKFLFNEKKNKLKKNNV